MGLIAQESLTKRKRLKVSLKKYMIFFYYTCVLMGGIKNGRQKMSRQILIPFLNECFFSRFEKKVYSKEIL